MSLIGRIEKAFRHFVVYPLFRMVFRNGPVDLPIELTSVRRLLLLRTDRLGDMVVTSSLIRRIRDLHPSIHLGMVVSHRNLAAARMVEGIDALHVIGGSVGGTVRSVGDARRIGYDVVLNLVFNRTTLGGMLANLIAPRGMKVGQGAEKYRFYFNAMVALERGKYHMAEILRSFGVQTFGPAFFSDRLEYSLKDEQNAARRIEAFMPSGKKAVLLNVSAGDPRRSMSTEQAVAVARGLLALGVETVILISGPGEETIRTDVVTHVSDGRVMKYPETGDASFADIVALVRRSHAVVTPDTSLVHIAGATKTPLVSMFVDPFARAEWHPRNTVFVEVMGDPQLPLSRIAPRDILDAFERLRQCLPT